MYSSLGRRFLSGWHPAIFVNPKGTCVSSWLTKQEHVPLFFRNNYTFPTPLRGLFFRNNFPSGTLFQDFGGLCPLFPEIMMENLENPGNWSTRGYTCPLFPDRFDPSVPFDQPIGTFGDHFVFHLVDGLSLVHRFFDQMAPVSLFFRIRGRERGSLCPIWLTIPLNKSARGRARKRKHQPSRYSLP